MRRVTIQRKFIGLINCRWVKSGLSYCLRLHLNFTVRKVASDKALMDEAQKLAKNSELQSFREVGEA